MTKKIPLRPTPDHAREALPQRLNAVRAGGTDSDAAIRNGVKTERDTQPVQVRMLKAQIKVLKALASLEERTASEVIRQLVDGYINYCLLNWEESEQLEILKSNVKLAGYDKEIDRENARVLKWLMEGGDGPLDEDSKYEKFSEQDAK